MPPGYIRHGMYMVVSPNFLMHIPRLSAYHFLPCASDPMNLISGVEGIKAMKAEGVISISNIPVFDYLYFVDSLINCACWELN